MVSVRLLADKAGRAHRVTERGLKALRVPYEMVDAGEHPEYRQRFGVECLPCLVIDDRIVYHGALGEAELRLIFAANPRGRIRVHPPSPKSPVS